MNSSVFQTSRKPAVRVVAATLFMTIFMLAGSAFAQGGDGPDPTVLDGLALQIQSIEAALQREGISDEQLAGLRDQIEPIRRDAELEFATSEPKLAEIKARIEQLGEPPAEDAPQEGDRIASERASLENARIALESVAQRAKLIVVQADQAASAITSLQRVRFTKQLTERTTSILAPAFWINFASSVPHVVSSLAQLLKDTNTYALNRMTIGTAILLVISILIVLIVWRILNRFLDRFTGRSNHDGKISQGEKAIAALVRYLRTSVSPILALAAMQAIIYNLDLINGSSFEILGALFNGAASILVYRGLAHSYLAARRPAWRMSAIDSADALKLTWLIILIATMSALDRFSASVSSVTLASVDFEVGTSGITALAIAVLTIALLRQIVGARKRADVKDGGKGLFSWSFLRITTWLALFVVLGGLILGYLSLASFVALQLVGVAIIVGIFRLLILACDHLFTKATLPGGSINAFAVREFSLPESTTHQAGILIAGLFNIVLFSLAVILILLPWGFDVAAWQSWLERAIFGFQMGGVRVAPVEVLEATGVFLIVIIVARTIRNWIENTYLPSTRLDMGLRNSISTTIGYVGLVAAGGIAISYAGWDLSNIAIIAGALSVGIGFGLQSIVSNFVSGLILLAERPIKSGDWIVVGAEEGIVRKVSVRATEIETFERASVIIPNSDLISGRVMNWTHSNTLGRFSINIGVSYDSDPDQVRDILMKIVSDHPDVLSFPEPSVIFMEFGASSLDFRVDGFLKNIGLTMKVRSDIRFQILRELRAAKIEIPFPQSDLHVRSVDPDAAQALAEGALLPQSKNEQIS